MFRETNEEEFGGEDCFVATQPEVFAPRRAAMLVSDCLDLAADKLAAPGAWIGGPDDHAYARNAAGERVAVDDPAACRWCISGALRSVRGEYPRAEMALLDGLCRVAAIWFNHQEAKSQAEVVAKLREAAQLAREQSQ